MIRKEDCVFQDGSYPCGYKDGGKLPDCELCEKIAKAERERIEKFVFYVDARGYIALKPHATENWQAILKEAKQHSKDEC